MRSVTECTADRIKYSSSPGPNLTGELLCYVSQIYASAAYRACMVVPKAASTV